MNSLVQFTLKNDHIDNLRIGLQDALKKLKIIIIIVLLIIIREKLIKLWLKPKQIFAEALYVWRRRSVSQREIRSLQTNWSP